VALAPHSGCVAARVSPRVRAHAVEPDEPNNPLHIRALGMNGIVMEAEYSADLIEEFWLLTSRGLSGETRSYSVGTAGAGARVSAGGLSVLHYI
jgi:hypothetical protein